MNENQLSYKAIGIALDLHKTLGPGLLESAYEAAFAYDLRAAGLKVENQLNVPFIYKDLELHTAFRLDLLIEGKLIIEIKSVEELSPLHYSQTLTYLKLTGLKLGLLINFNTPYLKEGINRIVNNL